MNNTEKLVWIELSFEFNHTKYELKLIPGFSFKRIKGKK